MFRHWGRGPGIKTDKVRKGKEIIDGARAN